MNHHFITYFLYVTQILIASFGLAKIVLRSMQRHLKRNLVIITTVGVCTVCIRAGCNGVALKKHRITNATQYNMETGQEAGDDGAPRVVHHLFVFLF